MKPLNLQTASSLLLRQEVKMAGKNAHARDVQDTQRGGSTKNLPWDHNHDNIIQKSYNRHIHRLYLGGLTPPVSPLLQSRGFTALVLGFRTTAGTEEPKVSTSKSSTDGLIRVCQAGQTYSYKP